MPSAAIQLRNAALARNQAALAARAVLHSKKKPLAKARPATVVRPKPAAAVVKNLQQQAERDRKQALALYRQHIARQRLDYEWLPNGTIRATLTITLPHGNEFRFTGEGDPRAIAMLVRGSRPDAVEGILGDIWKGIKKGAKAVATSGVFKTATKVLATVAPVLGPAAPAAMTAATTMGAATKLLAAKKYSAKGDTRSAAKLVLAASKQVTPKNLAHSPRAQKKTAKAAFDVADQHAQKIYTLLLRPA